MKRLLFLGFFLAAAGALFAQSAGSATQASAGLVVAKVMDNGPASNAGIAPGDSILQLDGQPVATMSDVRGILAKHQPGDSIPAVVLHNGQQTTVTIALAASKSGHPTIGAWFKRPTPQS